VSLPVFVGVNSIVVVPVSGRTLVILYSGIVKERAQLATFSEVSLRLTGTPTLSVEAFAL